MIRFSLALMLSIGMMLFLGPRVLPVLRKLKFGQPINALGPPAHKAKQGTPTMGGLLFSVVICVISLALHGDWLGKDDFTLALLCVSVLSMLIGFADDYIKVIRKRSLGLTWRQKILGQAIVGLLFSAYCYNSPYVGSKIIVPFIWIEWDLYGWYIPIMTLVMMFIVNSANLQDGLDGLLSSVTVIGSVAFGLIAIAFAKLSENSAWLEWTGNVKNLSIFSMTLAGACIGFLRFNHHPAQVIMGDTGSMFIGGALAGMAMLLRMPLFLLIIAFTLVISSLSVMMQVAYFKLTHGKRIFRMSPLHHHFELSGMSEPQVVALYAVTTGILSLFALLSVITRL